MEVCKIKQQWRKKQAVEPLCKTMHWEMYFKNLLSYRIKITPNQEAKARNVEKKMSMDRDGIIFWLKRKEQKILFLLFLLYFGK